MTATPMAFSARLDEQDEQSLSHAPITVFEEKVAGGDSRGQQGIAGLKDAIDRATRYLRSKQGEWFVGGFPDATWWHHGTMHAGTAQVTPTRQRRMCATCS